MRDAAADMRAIGYHAEWLAHGPYPLRTGTANNDINAYPGVSRENPFQFSWYIAYREALRDAQL